MRTSITLWEDKSTSPAERSYEQLSSFNEIRKQRGDWSKLVPHQYADNVYIVEVQDLAFNTVAITGTGEQIGALITKLYDQWQTLSCEYETGSDEELAELAKRAAAAAAALQFAITERAARVQGEREQAMQDASIPEDDCLVSGPF